MNNTVLTEKDIKALSLYFDSVSINISKFATQTSVEIAKDLMTVISKFN